MGLESTSEFQCLACHHRQGHRFIPFTNSLYSPHGRDTEASCAAINFPLKEQSLTKPPWIVQGTLILPPHPIFTPTVIYTSPRTGWDSLTCCLQEGNLHLKNFWSHLLYHFLFLQHQKKGSRKGQSSIFWLRRSFYMWQEILNSYFVRQGMRTSPISKASETTMWLEVLPLPP